MSAPVRRAGRDDLALRIARFEAGGTTPTLPLEILAVALGLTLDVSLVPAERRSA